MGLNDFKDRGNGGDGRAKEKGPTPEKRVFGNWLAQVPSQCQRSVRSIAGDNHHYFLDKFPKLEDFIDAVAEGWVKKKEAFEVNVEQAGFTPIVAGTRPQDLHVSIIACLTESGSWVLVGPGAFNKSMKAAALMYKKIPLRIDPEAPPDIEEPTGFAFGFNGTPRVGEQIISAPGSCAPFSHTSAVISAFMLPFKNREEAFEKMKAINAGLSRELAQVNADVGLAVVRSKT